MRHFKNFILTF